VHTLAQQQGGRRVARAGEHAHRRG
jgi:hypothetical protein